MGTYRVVGVGADRDVGDRVISTLLYGRVFVSGATRVGRIVDGVGNAVDEPNHSVLPVPNMIAEPRAEDT